MAQLKPGERSANKFRQVTYVIQATIEADDNSHDFHRHVASVLRTVCATRLPSVHITAIDVHAKSFHLFPSRSSPAVRHATEEQVLATPPKGLAEEVTR